MQLQCNTKPSFPDCKVSVHARTHCCTCKMQHCCCKADAVLLKERMRWKMSMMHRHQGQCCKWISPETDEIITLVVHLRWRGQPPRSLLCKKVKPEHQAVISDLQIVVYACSAHEYAETMELCYVLTSQPVPMRIASFSTEPG